MMWGYGGGWGMGLGWIIQLAVLGLIVWAVISFVRSRPGHPGSGPDRSLEILKERYAKGELDEEAYRRMRKELQQ